MRDSHMNRATQPSFLSRNRLINRSVIAAAGLVVTFVVVAFLEVGQWLVVEDPLSRADAILILSGDMPIRAIEAAKLYRDGYAPQVWLTHSTEPGKTLAAFGIDFTGEDRYNQLLLIRGGVPPGAIHVIDPPIVNTADEIRTAALALNRAHGSAVILVTSKSHTRRAGMLWRRLAVGSGRAVVRAAEQDPFDPLHWWRNTRDALEVVREVLGLLNVWAGLPLHPAR